MKILIVDPNVTYAKKIKELLLSVLKEETIIDVVSNVFLLRDRMTRNAYDFILADLESAFLPSELAKELEAVETAQVIYWSNQHLACLKNQICKPHSTQQVASLAAALKRTA